jgi:hypothetical protein
MGWKDFKAQARIVEEHFSKCLVNPKWADNEQDMFEHWDIEGELNGRLLTFDGKLRDVYRDCFRNVSWRSIRFCLRLSGIIDRDY